MDTPRAGTGEFVTVVSVQQPSLAPENFVTVLSIGSDKQQQQKQQSSQDAEDPAHPEEQVEVYRLPGERLGFGLKFDGGNKTSEKVRRLFIQSCAEQSPASRVKCSWGNLGEGDEVLSIDGVPVTQMTRLDCVRHLKESQLVIKLDVRYRGALRPEVVSAERKLAGDQQQQQQQQNGKTPPELPVSPPPVPPRKPRHSSHATSVSRGFADGEANSGSKKARESPKSNGSSLSGSPRSHASFRSATSSVKSATYESCASSPVKNINGNTDSPKNSPKVFVSPNFSKIKQNVSVNCTRQDEPAEAQWYLDARSQDGSSTHDSTSDDTGSSLSTVLDRLSSCANSDRISITSSLSSASELQQSQQQALDSPSFLLARLVGSEGRTHVESRGDVERVTALVAPNKVLIEEQPAPRAPLSFQDAPLSYGHEPQPGLLLSQIESSERSLQQQQPEPPKPAPRREARPRKRRPPPPPPPPPPAPRKLQVQPEPSEDGARPEEEEDASETNETTPSDKVLEIVEMRKARDVSPGKPGPDEVGTPTDGIEELRPESPERESELENSTKASDDAPSTTTDVAMEQEHDAPTDESDDGDYYWQSNLDTIGEEGESSHSDNDNCSAETLAQRINVFMENPHITQTLVEDSSVISAVDPDTKSASEDDDPAAAEGRIATECIATQDKKHDKSVVNVRMESCGEGGQRLPPDGDEFPAAYHEFVLGPMRSSSGADVKRPHHQQQQSLHCLGPSRDPPRTAAELLNDPEPESQRPTMALPPPPLPSSAPPSSAQPQQQQQHQESGSSCWRQDNRSERSVRDKIAMFTSQAGGVEAPLFPSPHPPARRPPQQGPKTQPRASLAAPTKPTTTTPAVIGSASNGLTRATSFSGLANGAAEAGGYPARQQHLEKPQPLARTNSLASTFSRPAAVDENARRSSLSQLIEQRRKGMSKLRGLVIPEKDALASLSSAEQQPIVDLPEIRSRDSILNNQQATRSVSLQQQYSDVGSKWGSQGSLSSPTRSVYVASSFKMPAPKILSSYSPAFKRKSLAVYGSGTCSTSPPPPPSPQSRPSSKQSSSSSSSNGGQQLASPDLAPKSLESICSPTRSDYSFEFAGSPTLMLGCSSSPPNAAHPTSAGTRLTNGAATGAARPSNGSAKQTTLCYHDDSDNDSAVSSSQSSISRGFSPPASPVPSDRSTLSSSERSYLSSCGEAPSFPGVQQQSSNAPSRTAQRQQQQQQQSVESLSRRVLKPQSVEAINRKNILASARCRSGRDQNVGSPLIQRKFDPDEEADDESGERHRSPPTRVSNGCHHRQPDDVGDALVDGADGKPQIKIAYIEIADETLECEQPPPPPRLPPKRNLPSHHNYSPIPSSRLARVEAMEPSNDMKSWVRSEIRSLRNSADSKATPIETITPITNGRNFRSRSTLALNESNPDETERDHVDAIRPKSRLNLVGSNKSTDDHDDLLAVLTTKSRSRSAIHVEDTSYGKLKSQMSLEDMLGTSGSTTTSGCKLPRSQSVIESNGVSPFSLASKATMATATSPATRDERSHRFRRSDSTDSWSEDRTAPYSSNASRTSSFVRSGCDTGGRASSGLDDGLELALENGKLLNGAAPSRIPMPRNLGRRSASVTDMKKVFERAELGGHNATISSTPSHLAQSHAVPAAEHSRFPSLDSSLSAEEGSSLGVGSGGGASMGLRPSGSASQIEHERFNGEQFGSISSLASSTSLISQQELAQLVEEANLEEPRGGHDVVVVLLHKENPAGGVGIILAGGSDCESKEISVHRVLCHSIADKEGSVQRGDRILSINGRSMRGLSHRESLAVLKQPRSELVLVVSRPSAASSARPDEAPLGSCASSSVLAQQQHQHRSSAYSPTTRLHAVADSHEDLAHHGFEASNGLAGNSAWGPPVTVTMYKDGAGLGFSLEGGRDSPLGDRPLLIKKIFTGGAAEKTGALRAGDQLLEVNKRDVSRMSRIEAWSFMKKLSDGEVNLLVRHPATKSS